MPPAVGVLTAVAIGAVALAGWCLVGVTATAGVGAAGVFLTIAATDAIELRIPDRLSLPLVAGGVVLAAVGVWPVGILPAVVGAAALYALGAVFSAVGRKTGVGAVVFGRGDWKLLAATGAWLGLGTGALIAAVGLFLSATLLLAAARSDRAATAMIPFGAILGPLTAAGVLWAAFGPGGG